MSFLDFLDKQLAEYHKTPEQFGNLVNNLTDEIAVIMGDFIGSCCNNADVGADRFINLFVFSINERLKQKDKPNATNENLMKLN